MKRYRLHDLLRAAALAYATSACGGETATVNGADTGIAGDAGEDAQVGTDAAAADVDVKVDIQLVDVQQDAASDVAVADVGKDAALDTTGDATKDAGAFAFACGASTPITSQGQVTGFETCVDGLVHRPAVKSCPAYVPDPNKICNMAGNCTTDSDCASTPGGHCDMGVDSPCFCQPSCVSDSDCGTGQICECGEKFGTCVQAACKSDHDCADGMVCGFYVSKPGCDFPAFACQTAVDSCGVTADCPNPQKCTWDAAQGHRFCSAPMCAIGRPYEVDGAWRTADVVNRTDWLASLGVVEAPHLDAAVRRQLADYWLEAARMEHASVASFARLTLELLAVGAPPELLAASTQAAQDEVRHAQTCFGLATLFGAPDLGPGPLVLDTAGRTPTLLAIAAAAAREGCVWETTAALEAHVAAAECRLPAVQEALERIADDEASHADLAWQIVRWACDAGGEEVRAAVAAAIDEATAELASRSCGDDFPDGLGVIRGKSLRRLRAHAILAVIGPARRNWLG
jgi:hypothetical protein